MTPTPRVMSATEELILEVPFKFKKKKNQNLYEFIIHGSGA